MRDAYLYEDCDVLKKFHEDLLCNGKGNGRKDGVIL